MKHRIGFNALSRNRAERKALKRNMVTSLFRYEKIETTLDTAGCIRIGKLAKAKEVSRVAEKMITRAKDDTTHNRRLTASVLYDDAIVDKLFKEIAPLYLETNGGYTRIIKTQYRNGDSAEMAILELTKKTEKPEKEKKAKQEKA